MPSFSTISNREKSIHGNDHQANLLNMLDDCLQNGYLIDVVKEYRIGNPSCQNQEQFYAPFMIQFSNKEKWIIFSTTSMRTDRIKGQQWDAFNLKSLDPLITKAFLVFPDDIDRKERELFIKQNQKYEENFELSAIDQILSFSACSFLIKKEFLKSVEEEIDTQKFAPEVQDSINSIIEDTDISEEQNEILDDILNDGQIWDKQGKSFETQIAEILSSKTYLANLKEGKVLPDQDFHFFKEMMQAFNLNVHDIKTITATTDKDTIGRLPSGGTPKTDVAVFIEFKNGKNIHIGISCKRSKNNSVSVHQYSADTFADVLDSNNQKLRRLLNIFQYCGNAKDLPEKVANELEQELAPYLRK